MNYENKTRDRLALALDFDDLVEALSLARQVKEFFSVAKVGLELFSASGPDAIEAFLELDYRVFCDLKLYDIPNTVHKAARVIGGLGASYLTVHASGGQEVMQAAGEGFLAGAQAGGFENPVLLGVTVLTSDSDHTHSTVVDRARLAQISGCAGVVCSGDDVLVVTQEVLNNSGVQNADPRKNFDIVVPGIRLDGDSPGDQKRVVTPERALRDGATLLVVGRSVTSADDPKGAARKVFEAATLGVISPKPL